MIKYIKILALMAFLCSTVISFAQPKATIQFFGGYSMPLGDFKGNFGTTDTTVYGAGSADTMSYLMKSGLNYGISYKKPLTKSGNLNLSGTILFNAFHQKGEYTTVNVTLRYNVLTLALGAEWQFFPKKKKVNPSVAVEFMSNYFNGSLTEAYPTTTTTLNLRSTWRFGFLFSGGVDFALHQNVGLYAGAKYAIANMIGKEYEGDTQTTYGLNDKQHGLYPDRTISYFMINAGVSFYFGK